MKMIRSLQIGLLLIASCIAATAGVMQCVNSTNELIQLNPRTISTNTFVVSDSGVIGSGSAYIWTYDSASSATQDGNHLKPLNYNGRWIRDSFGVGGIPPPPPSPTDLWQESSGAYSPRLPEQVLYATNIVSDQSLLVTGSFGYTITTNITLADSAVNNLTAYRQGIVQLNSPDTDPLVVQIQLSSGQFMGQRLLLENMVTGTGFSLLNGSPLWDDGSLNVVLQYGSWVSTTEGDSLELMWTQKGWREIARLPGAVTVVQGDHLWNLTNGVMYTAPELVTNRWEFRESGIPQLTIGTNGILYPGSNSFSYFGATAMVLSAVRLPDTGEGQLGGIQIYSVSTNGFGAFDANVQTNFSFTGVSWNPNDGFTAGRQADLNANATEANLTISDIDGGNRVVWTDAGTGAIYDAAGDQQLFFGPDPSITWGTGTPHKLYRLDNYLIWTNDNINGAWFGTSSDQINFGYFGSAGNTARVIGPTAIYLQGNESVGAYAVVNASSLVPSPDGALSLGTAANQWNGAWITNALTIAATNDHAGNYSWVKCFVTNGVAVFDFQNAGTGTAPSKFSFMFNGVEQGHIP